MVFPLSAIYTDKVYSAKPAPDFDDGAASYKTTVQTAVMPLLEGKLYDSGAKFFLLGTGGVRYFQSF